MPRMPSTSPIAPPITDSATLSVSNWRMIRPRPAPIAARRATSRLRAVARTSSRFATLAQAISRTNATAALRISSVGRAFLTNTCCRPFDAEAVVLLQRLRELGAEFVCRQLQPRLRLLERDTRLETRGRLEEVTLIDGVRIELERDPEIGLLSELRDVELRADDADDDEWIAAERDRLADDAGIRRESPRPEAVAEHGHLLAARPIFFRRERAAHHHARPKQTEVVCADFSGAQLFGELPSRVVDDVGAERRRVLDDRRLLPPVRELGRRRIRSGPLRRRVHEQDDPVRIRERDRLQQHGADDREDGRVRADAEGERGNGRRRERPVLEKHPKRVFQILDEQLHTPSIGNTEPGTRNR